jgi:ubiquinone/menaquinone biosynthesis C-methylase UbiE
MSFYEEIAKYYDYIFPTGKDQVNFIKNHAGEGNRALLDIACGTGGYSLELAKLGYKVTALDLDVEMIEGLKAKISSSGFDVKALVGNMLELDRLDGNKYDLAFCIGNSLVHLAGEKEIEEFFKDVKRLTGDKGKFLVQIINFDRILSQNVQALPTIENKDIGLTFQRLYRYDESQGKIYFKTILTVNKERLENEIPLYPLLSSDILKLLKGAGFDSVQLFGDFKGNEYQPENSYTLVALAS